MLDEYVIAVRESRIRVVSVNTYISGLNCFLSWLHEKDHTPARLTIRKLKMDQSFPKVVEASNVVNLVGYQGRTFRTRRVHAVVCTVLDTGLRINEVLTVRNEAVNLDDLTIRVMGKGRRERIVPFSTVLRRILVRWFNSLPDNLDNCEFAFPTKDGDLMGYRNLHRDYGVMCGELGIARPGGFHRLRHTFATDYLRHGGNSRYLQMILGHSSITTTEKYTHPDAESMQLAHTRHSPLVNNVARSRRNSGSRMASKLLV